MSDQAAQMGAHFDAAGRLARSQHDRDGAASLGVVEMDLPIPRKPPGCNGIMPPWIPE
jgi:hypothetical protein